MIPKETIDKIYEVAKIEEVVGDFLPLKKKGVNYIGNCPFHDEKTPSFIVSPVKGIFKCFGCGKGGNAVKFIMEIEHYNYPEALRLIAKKYQIEIIEKKLTAEEKIKKSEKESLYIIVNFAKTHFQNSLWETEEGRNIGLSYFKERGFSESTVKYFELGYNQKKKDDFTKEAIKHAFDKTLLLKAGVSIQDQNKKHIDRFNERIIFPIHSFSGRVLGFGGRALNKKQKAKYINSPESTIYYKSKVLYGLFQAKSSIAKEDNCLIVEGYTDVISMHQNGITNVVAASGTALGVEQLKLISRITKNICLLFDADEAGIKATYRTIDLALKEGMHVNIVTFPDGEDPDSFVKKFSEKEIKKFLYEKSLNFIDYKILISNIKKETNPQKITRLKRNIFQSIAVIPDSLMRTEYCRAYHGKLNIDEKIMLNEISKIRKEINLNHRSFEKVESLKQKPPLQEIDITPSNQLEAQEKEILRLLINYGNEKFLFEKEEITVAEMIINDLSADSISFSIPEFNILYTEIKKQNNSMNVNDFINHKNQNISDLVVNLVNIKHTISENWSQRHNIYTARENEKMRITTEKAILALKKCHVNMEILNLQEKIKNGSINNDEVIRLSTLTKLKSQIAKVLGRNIG